MLDGQSSPGALTILLGYSSMLSDFYISSLPVRIRGLWLRRLMPASSCPHESITNLFIGIRINFVLVPKVSSLL